MRIVDRHFKWSDNVHKQPHLRVHTWVSRHTGGRRGPPTPRSRPSRGPQREKVKSEAQTLHTQPLRAFTLKKIITLASQLYNRMLPRWERYGHRIFWRESALCVSTPIASAL